MRRAACPLSCRSYVLFGLLAWILLGMAGIGPLALAETLIIDASSETPPAAESPAPAPPAIDLATPTHRQQSLIEANVEGQPKTSVTCFALTQDDRILAGCSGTTGEIRVFDADGKHVKSWPTPVQPEAIFVRADGTIVLAGEGQLVRLAADGKVELQKPAPHAAALEMNSEKTRDEIIAQAKQQAEAFANQTSQFTRAIESADKQIARIKEQLAQLEEAAKAADDDDDDDDESDAAATAQTRNAQAKLRLERRMASQQRIKEQYESAAKQWDEMVKQNAPAELTEERIDELVKAAIAAKLKASSISATNDEVFVATRAAAGYGFEIWRMDNEFENGAAIVSELRGCCGQMDVKANANGLYVAENSRHRVCRYDREGSLLGTWGRGDRTGIEGFGSCCNPMNVAFGPADAVYTAEDNTGRIKRYSLDGQLLGLVGSVDLVPGCKNCSIAVNGDGSRVYMLDITRNHIVRMDGPAPDNSAVPAPAARAADGADNVGANRPAAKSSAGRIIAAGLKALFDSDD